MMIMIRTSGDVATFPHMVIVAQITRTDVSCFRCIDTVVEIMSDILQKLVWAEEHPNFGAATDL